MMANAPDRTEAEFLLDCSNEVRDAYVQFFKAIRGTAAGLEPPVESLEFDFAETVGWSLKLKRTGLPNTASLLWGFPSQASEARPGDRQGPRDLVRTVVHDLEAAEIDGGIIQAFGQNLEQIGFQPQGDQNWRTPAGANELCGILNNEETRQAIIEAIRDLIDQI